MKISTFLLCVLLSVFVPSAVFAGLDDGLILHYPFDQDSGAIVQDESGQGHHGTVVGAIFMSGEGKNGAYYFDAGARVDVGNVIDIGTVYSTLTVSCWSKVPPSEHKREIWFVSKNQAAVPYTGWSLGLTAGNPFSEVIGRYPEWSCANAGFTTCDDHWHFICGIMKVAPGSLETRVYVDGVWKDTYVRNGSHSSTATGAGLWIGSRAPDASCALKGLLDDVRIYGRDLSNDEIQDLYVSTAPPLPVPPFITLIGFSSQPNGDQDVTVFYRDETLYAKVKDVSLESSPFDEVRVRLKQPGNKKAVWMYLERAPDGCFTGSTKLSVFRAGTVQVRLFGTFGGVTKLVKDVDLTIH